MKHDNNSRRRFLGSLATGTAVSSLGIMPQILQAATPINTTLVPDADSWLKKGIKGKHRVVYDGPEPHNAFPIIWTWAFYYTNNQTGADDDDMTGVCVLRHNGIPFAMKDELWAKYNFGEVFKINDNTTEAPAVRNPYYQPKDGDFPLPFIEGIKKLQNRGAMFCVCDLAMTVFSGAVAQAMNMDPEKVKQEWVAGLLPGVQLVPSGVWALGRAQKYGCGYIYAGG
ncbi:Tat (twin-arginine translocation) pathway signal sequence containing protein [Flavilitoribacter nigricans]|uniref:Tat (Twin-arginine translocation) pathway signal sequence containing protein n=1 Tax=Flavilitoribacter nigricans (strain ATCC 23147 / DSM 23189 / NBRC 102662 / NCIMB 1420 / SS-2) TaxID=1122177 RepID=A0A2D0MZE4_FLAN2|nr:Tat (twin-arginine translocation) pathway signal sequence containing protein [Flavilitoribacter nigricans]PHN01587.1 Tat (twin-arginine translocation) pathway signal sequence containing protein [Flavilitoribacter nigricans DSM 23189 = NBRC 102662]